MLDKHLSVPCFLTEKCKSARSTPSDGFPYTVEGFGLCNATAAFQRLMTAVILDLKVVH